MKRGAKIAIVTLLFLAILAGAAAMFFFTSWFGNTFTPKTPVEYAPYASNFASTVQAISYEEAEEALGDDYITPDGMGDDYEVTYSKVDATSSYEDIFAMGVNNDILWPGALIDISTEAYKKIDVPRSDLTISGSFESAIGRTEGAELAQTVDSPSLANVRTAIGKIVNSNLRPGVNLANAGFSCSIHTVRNDKEFSMNLGFGLKVAGFGLENNFTYKNINKQTNLVMVLKQVFYTIDADGPGDIKTIDMIQLGKDGQIPAYVSSVSYGRIAIISIQTNYSSDEVSNALNASYGKGAFSINGNLTIDDLASDSDTTISCYVYGGSLSDTGNMVSVATGDISETLKSWGEAISTEDAIGMPVSYKIRHLDGEMAKLQDAASYVVKEVTYKPKKLISWDSLDRLILSGDYLKRTRVTIDLSSVLLKSSDFSQPGEVHAERIIKIPKNVEEFILIGANDQTDMSVLSLSLIVSEREKTPLTMTLRGITFTAQTGESAIRVEGRDDVTIVLSQRNKISASGIKPAIDSPNGKVIIEGTGTLAVYGGDGGAEETGGTGLHAKELELLSENVLNFYGGNGGDGGTNQNGGDGGVAIDVELLTVNMPDGEMNCYGGNGGNGGNSANGGNGGVGIACAMAEINSATSLTIIGGNGGNGGDGKDSSSRFENGNIGGIGGNGTFALSCSAITFNNNATLLLIGGDGGNGGNGGRGFNGKTGWGKDKYYVATKGGNGGNGGNGEGALSCGSTIEFWGESLRLVTGNGGNGGNGGHGGDGGVCDNQNTWIVSDGYWKGTPAKGGDGGNGGNKGKNNVAVTGNFLESVGEAGAGGNGGEGGAPWKILNWAGTGGINDSNKNYPADPGLPGKPGL